jgi:cilla- and flagella-associated protein
VHVLQVSSLEELRYLSGLSSLRVLWLSDNPCAEEPHYHDAIRKHLTQLSKLDNICMQQLEQVQAGKTATNGPERASTSGKVQPEYTPLRFNATLASKRSCSGGGGAARVPLTSSQPDSGPATDASSRRPWPNSKDGRMGQRQASGSWDRLRSGGGEQQQNVLHAISLLLDEMEARRDLDGLKLVAKLCEKKAQRMGSVSLATAHTMPENAEFFGASADPLGANRGSGLKSS